MVFDLDPGLFFRRTESAVLVLLLGVFFGIISGFVFQNWNSVKAKAREIGRAIASYFLSHDRRAVERACRICGCTDRRACLGGCSWAEEDLCTSCVGVSRDRAKRRAIDPPYMPDFDLIGYREEPGLRPDGMKLNRGPRP